MSPATPCLRTDNGASFPLVSDKSIIGRNSSAKNIINDIDLTRYDTQKIVSRRHAMIQRKGDEFWLYDLNSRNGTFVNGKRLSPREAHILKMGDVVEFGNGGVKLTFNI